MSDEQRQHHAGECWCGITHSVAGAKVQNDKGIMNQPGPEYDAMIRRTEGQEDPLVQEPKK